jgi:hypothetical protein
MPFAMTPDEGLALADTVPGVHSAQDIKLPPGRGVFKLLAWLPFDRGFLSHFRPSNTLLEFDR